jgi:pimeloyl-ACP methyl ester carboxylesterase
MCPTRIHHMVILVSTPPLVDLPHGVRRGYVTCQRARLATLTVGKPPQADDGSSQVLLVPGFTGSKEDFISILPLLDRIDIAAVAIDQLGQFESIGTDDPTEYTIAKLAQDLVDVAEQMGEPIHLVGHSLGGLVSRAAVTARPELFRSLVLLDSGPAAIPQQNQGLLLAFREALHGMSLAQIWQAKLELDQATGVPLPPPELIEFLEKRWVTNNRFSLVEMIETLLTIADSTSELALSAQSANLPILVAFGEGDIDLWPTDLQSDMARRLSADVAAVPNAAHSPAAENPAATAEILTRFWNGCK